MPTKDFKAIIRFYFTAPTVQVHKNKPLEQNREVWEFIQTKGYDSKHVSNIYYKPIWSFLWDSHTFSNKWLKRFLQVVFDEGLNVAIHHVHNVGVFEVGAMILHQSVGAKHV